MEEQISNKEILEKLNQLQIEVNILKERFSEEDSNDELLDQVKESLEDAKAGRIRRVA